MGRLQQKLKKEASWKVFDLQTPYLTYLQKYLFDFSPFKNQLHMRMYIFGKWMRMSMLCMHVRERKECMHVHLFTPHSQRPLDHFGSLDIRMKFAFSESEAIQKKEVKNRLKVRILWRYQLATIHLFIYTSPPCRSFFDTVFEKLRLIKYCFIAFPWSKDKIKFHLVEFQVMSPEFIF